ncbi:hypothetical protein [Marinobacter sp. es.048]|uniref:hypothetical protein n=1 Tax=Marinobacter sp. es.048 TaxID=1761795 RepID=UPI001131D2FC|nr:hypothetical protein [Marinobacter sp. es.048]
MIIKYAVNFTLCAYYLLLTPKTYDYEANLENYLYGVVFTSIFHAVGMYYLLHWLGWMDPLIDLTYELTGYYAGQGIEIAIFLGVWNLIGGLQYPALQEYLKEDMDPHKGMTENQIAYAEAKESVEREYRDEAQQVWNKILREKTAEYCLDYLKRSKDLIDDGHEPSAYWGHREHFRLMEDPSWMKAEIKRLKKATAG